MGACFCTEPVVRWQVKEGPSDGFGTFVRFHPSCAVGYASGPPWRVCAPVANWVTWAIYDWPAPDSLPSFAKLRSWVARLGLWARLGLCGPLASLGLCEGADRAGACGTLFQRGSRFASIAPSPCQKADDAWPGIT